MAQIFVSHSRRDKDLVNFFSSAFAGTRVKAVFEEFEKLMGKNINSTQIIDDIRDSKAIFVLLSHNVEGIPHTRDWIIWETGVATNKDIWVFEPYSQLGRISIIIPNLRHYVIFDTNDSWLAYIRSIIESYDDSHVLPTVLAAGGVGALTGSVILGALAGLAISDKSKARPDGIKVICSNCSSSYSIHMPQGMTIFRCPVCNTFLKLDYGAGK